MMMVMMIMVMRMGTIMRVLMTIMMMLMTKMIMMMMTRGLMRLLERRQDKRATCAVERALDKRHRVPVTPFELVSGAMDIQEGLERR
jgi:hypothetical protein